MDRAAGTAIVERSVDVASTIADRSVDVAATVGSAATAVGSKVLETAVETATEVIDTATDAVQRVIDRRSRRRSGPPAGFVIGLLLALGVIGAVVVQRRRNRMEMDRHARDAAAPDEERAVAAA